MLERRSETSAALPADERQSRRANVFLSAVIRVGGSSIPVRIRNLSRSGALVDGNDVPNRGDMVRLQRGPHSVAARVVWGREDACGLRFSSAVPVQEWIAYAGAHRGQQQVDEMIAGVRAGAPAALADALTGSAAIDHGLVVEQLEFVSEQLEEIGESLSGIPSVVEQGSAALQGLDMARQKLVDLAARLRFGQS